MPIKFYPSEEDLESGSIPEKLEVLQEAAQQYKAFILDNAAPTPEASNKKIMVPKDLNASYNWQEIAKLLHEIRDLPEATQANKVLKADHLTKLAEIYEVLRGAKMAKLEAVRLALMNEAAQLRSASQVA